MGHEIALISDIHFGCRGNSERYITTMTTFFKESLFNVLKSRNINDLRILGDLFDNRNALNVRTINAVIDVFTFLETNLPLLKIKILMGNHDQYYHNRYDIISLNILRNFNNIEIIDKVSEDTINGKNILMVPWIVPETTIYEDYMGYVRKETKFDLLLGHFEINGFEVSPGITDTHGIQLRYFRNFSRVFSGHYHLRNTMDQITYLGCPYQLSWGDYGNTKGIHVYDVDTNETTFIENTLSPRFQKVYMTELAEGNKESIANVSGNFVKLIIEKKYNETAIQQVIALLESKGAILTIDNQYVEQTEISTELSTADLSKLHDPLSFLMEYVKIIDIPDDMKDLIDKKELMVRAAEIYRKLLSDKD
jgi:hypothetical protein